MSLASLMRSPPSAMISDGSARNLPGAVLLRSEVVLGEVEQIIQPGTLAQDVVGEPHEVAAVRDDLGRVGPELAGGGVVEPVVLPHRVERGEDCVGAQVGAD